MSIVSNRDQGAKWLREGGRYDHGKRGDEGTRGQAIVMIIYMDNKSTKNSVREQGSEQWNLQSMRESDTVE